MEQAESLAAANKRIANILRKNDVESIMTSINQDLLQEPAEQALAEKLASVDVTIRPLLAHRDYSGVLTSLADMRETVDAFFDSVMVMDEDMAVRHNRFALLNQTRALFLEVADISYLQE
jgi:glycyl-tRNA synthetase beta chain